MGLSAYIVGIEKKFLTLDDAVERVLKMLQFFYNSRQDAAADATGYKGLYYHSLEMDTGKRTRQCELSTLDIALLMMGVLSAGAYFTNGTKYELQIGQLADALYRRY